MAPRYQQGYKPIQTRETAALDALSVRFIQHMEDNINSTMVALSPKLIAQVWPDGIGLADVHTSNLEVDLAGIWGPFKIPWQYDSISWTISLMSMCERVPRWEAAAAMASSMR